MCHWWPYRSDIACWSQDKESASVGWHCQYVEDHVTESLGIGDVIADNIRVTNQSSSDYTANVRLSPNPSLIEQAWDNCVDTIRKCDHCVKQFLTMSRCIANMVAITERRSITGSTSTIETSGCLYRLNEKYQPRSGYTIIVPTQYEMSRAVYYWHPRQDCHVKT